MTAIYNYITENFQRSILRIQKNLLKLTKNDEVEFTTCSLETLLRNKIITKKEIPKSWQNYRNKKTAVFVTLKRMKRGRYALAFTPEEITELTFEKQYKNDMNFRWTLIKLLLIQIIGEAKYNLIDLNCCPWLEW